jgi:hypothetical protein
MGGPPVKGLGGGGEAGLRLAMRDGESPSGSVGARYNQWTQLGYQLTIDMATQCCTRTYLRLGSLMQRWIETVSVRSYVRLYLQSVNAKLPT